MKAVKEKVVIRKFQYKPQRNQIKEEKNKRVQKVMGLILREHGTGTKRIKSG